MSYFDRMRVTKGNPSHDSKGRFAPKSDARVNMTPEERAADDERLQQHVAEVRRRRDKGLALLKK